MIWLATFLVLSRIGSGSSTTRIGRRSRKEEDANGYGVCKWLHSHEHITDLFVRKRTLGNAAIDGAVGDEVPANLETTSSSFENRPARRVSGAAAEQGPSTQALLQHQDAVVSGVLETPQHQDQLVDPQNYAVSGPSRQVRRRRRRRTQFVLLQLCVKEWKDDKWL